MLALALLLAAAASGLPARTLRVDFFHTGTATTQQFALDAIVQEPLPWPGPPDRRLDDTGFGAYQLRVSDAKAGTVLYTRAFASVFGEWRTTEEAKAVARTFHESLRFPTPAAPVKVTVLERAPDLTWKEVWTLEVDPQAPTVDRSAAPPLKVWSVLKSGDPQDKVDLLLLGDGYTVGEMAQWHQDARRLTDILFAQSPFKERRSDFNVWAIDTPADESGVSRPSDGVWRRSPLRTSYDAFGSERYILNSDNKRLREVAALAPYEFMEIVVNDRKYGGGGLHNVYATVSADNAFTPYVFVHEFGHHFAALADEYYTSAVQYELPATPIEPWEPNATIDPSAAKWKDLVTAGAPLPTPWPKAEFEKAQLAIQAQRRKIRAEKRPESEMEALFKEERDKMTALLGKSEHAHAVGAFEGAAYQAKGYYRPQADCTMFTRDEVGFCAVCRRAINRVIDQYASRR